MTTEYTPNFGLALPDFRMAPWHDLLNDDIKKIDALLANALSTANVQQWTNNTAYIEGVSVLDETDATIWICLVGHTSPTTGTFAEARSANPEQWTRLLTGFAPRGEWKNSTSYFPYDLAYQSDLGIFALCEQAHVSNPTGTLKDDEDYWAFLCDLSASELATAVTVTYSNAASPTLPDTNVQAAIDKLEDFVVSLNAVNVTQGEDIAGLRADMEAAITNLTNITMKLAGNQIVTGGFRITPFNAGNSSSPFTPDTLKGNYQYISNVGAFTLQAPPNDCAMDILITNSATAGIVTFTGFQIGLNIGDLMTIDVGHKFIVSIRRINNTATYSVKALQ
jgi:hypothetical protein